MTAPTDPAEGRRYGAPRPGIPGMRGVEQLGFCVPDIEVATTFFEDVLGFERFFDAGPYADPSGMFMATNYNLDPRAVVNTIRLFRGPNINIELFDCVFPGQDREWPGFMDVGGWHLGLYVDDMDAAIEYLAGKDVRPMGGKKDLMGPEAGQDGYYCHFLTSWGFYLELLTYPHGRAYERAAAPRRLWDPSRPDL